MSSKELILKQLRSAPSGTSDPNEDNFDFSPLFRSPSPSDLQKLLTSFSERFTTLQGEFHHEVEEPQAAEKLFEILEQTNGPLAIQEDDLLIRLRQLHKPLDTLLNQSINAGDDTVRFAEAKAGILLADRLCARTGSVLIRSTRCGGRRMNILPPLCVILARKEQIIPTLAPWLEELEQDPDWSLASIISGPSRTADIEKILVLGAHGPRRLALLLLG